MDKAASRIRLRIFLLKKSAKQDKHGNLAKLSQSARSYCFDYQKLIDLFGINLITGDSDDEEDKSVA